MKKGEILRGPRSEQIMEFFSMLGKPPIPEAETMPNSSLSNSSLNPASCIASLAALIPSCMKRSIFFYFFAINNL